MVPGIRIVSLSLSLPILRSVSAFCLVACRDSFFHFAASFPPPLSPQLHGDQRWLLVMLKAVRQLIWCLRCSGLNPVCCPIHYSFSFVCLFFNHLSNHQTLYTVKHEQNPINFRVNNIRTPNMLFKHP